MSYREIAPTPALRRYVRCFWVARATVVDVAEARPQRVLPDGCMDIILARRGTERDGREAFALTAVGAMTRFLDATALPLRLGVRFEPGMGAAFFGAHAPSLTDAEVPLGEFWGEEEERLLSALTHSSSTSGRIRTLERFLIHRLDAARVPDPDVQSIVERIRATRGQLAVADLVRSLRWSDRHLRRRFRSTVGVGPKTFARIVRLQEAVRRASAAPIGWADVAAEAGYYDQAHMIAEFRALAGRTPVEQLAAQS